MLALRLHLLEQRLKRNKLFKPPALSHGVASKEHIVLTHLDALLGRKGSRVVLGLLTAAAVGALAMIGVFLAGHTTGSWLGWGLGLFFVGWVLQFLGHYYEGRKPAFVDDLIGLLVGPMFIVAEALFSAGWNRQMLIEIERRVGPTHLRNLAHA